MRMLFSRAGTYPPTAVGRLASDSFSPNTAVGACLLCHGLGTTHTVSESSLVPDASLSIRDGAIAAWPGAWQGKNLRDVLVALGHDVDTPWRDLPHASRDWILFTEEQPVVQVTPLRDRIEKPYQGRFWSAKSYVMHTLADSKSQTMRERVLRFVETGPCPRCGGSGLKAEALAVTFLGHTIAELNAMPLSSLADSIRPTTLLNEATAASSAELSGEATEVAVTITSDLLDRIEVLLGLGYLGLSRSTPIGRTPRSNLATYTGLFDAVRKAFAATAAARTRGFGAGRFSFNIPGGRCETCQGEGFVAVELLFLPGSYAPCPTCHGSRYNPETLEVTYRDKNIAEVLGLTVDTAAEFLSDDPLAARSLETLREVGLGYLRLGQPAPELSDGEAQRIKLATELQQAGRRHTLYLLDEPTTGLHPADVQLLLKQLGRLVDAGNTVVVVEHDMDVVAAADWVIGLGPGGGDAGRRIMVAGTPETVAAEPSSRTAPYLARRLTGHPRQARTGRWRS